jgi:hypothetical protein
MGNRLAKGSFLCRISDNLKDDLDNQYRLLKKNNH